MTGDTSKPTVTVGVLALQGAFSEHLQLLKRAAADLDAPYTFNFILVRATAQLDTCSALIIPGGESTTMALIAERSGLLEPLRDFVKVSRRPTWGTCAGMILLAETANRTKQGGQELIGGLDVVVNRNHFGRQVESFTAPLKLGFLGEDEKPFNGVFIRAPIVQALLPAKEKEGEVTAPSRTPKGEVERGYLGQSVEVLAELHRGGLPKDPLNKPDRPITGGTEREQNGTRERERAGDARVVAVKQGNVVGTSFHPELTGDIRMHRWWLKQVVEDLERRQQSA